MYASKKYAYLATEMLNIKNGVSPVIASEIFVRETKYFFKLRQRNAIKYHSF